MKRIRDILTRNKTPVIVQDDVTYKQVTIRTNYKGVVLRGTQGGSTIGTKNQFAVSAGQFILSRIDARNGAFGIIPDELEGAIVTNDFLAFDINENEVEREFFNVFLQSPVFLEACIKASRGNTNRKRVDEAFFLNYPVDLPPLQEQHKQIKQINKCRTKLALAQHEITRQQSLLAKLKQAILQEAVQGKLTTDWRAVHPDVEPASQLLQRIQAEKARLIAEKKLRKEKPLPKITPDEIPFEIPKGWEWCRLGNVAMYLNGYAFKSQWFVPEGIRLVRNANVSHGVLDWSDTACIPNARLSEFDSFQLAEGDIVLSLDRPIISTGLKAARIESADLPALLLQRVLRIEPVVLSGEFVFKWLFSPLFQGSINPGRSIGVPHVSHNEVMRAPFPLPPLAEQAAIVECVEAMMATCRALEAEIEHARTHAAHLLQAVLKEAFAPAHESIR